MRLPAFRPETNWVAPSMTSLPAWAGARRVCVDIETKDPDLRKMGPGVRTNGEIIGVGFAIEDGPSFYLPVRHRGGGNLPEEQVFQYLRDQARGYEGEIVGANLQYDMDFLAEAGVLFRGLYRDVQISEPLIDELQFSYSLENIARRYGLPGKDETLLKQYAACLGVDPQKGMWQLPAAAVGAYAEQDVRLPLKILRLQERRLEKQELWEVFDMECRLQKVLLKMKRRGVRVDFDKLDQIDRLSTEKELEALQEITRQTGISLSVADTTRTAALVPVLTHHGIPIPQTAKGNDSLKNDYLEALDHPVAELIVEARKWNKLRGTFVASIRTHAVGDRIHCTFNQLRRDKDDGSGDEEGARYGRLSCVNPNLQQQPARDPEIGPLWRSIYIPDEGGQWACLDYSQQEPRWLTHYAELCRLPKAQEAAERYRTDPATDNHQMMADLCGIPRKPAKIIYLALCYGMGGGKMSRKLGLPTVMKTHTRSGRQYEAAGPECQKLIDAFNSGAPYVRALSDRCAEAAVAKGYIRTAGGRRCRFPHKPTGGYDWTHKALNRLIQGSSGDQTKWAMVNADEAGVRIQLQVHDELDMTFWDRQEIELCAEVMREALPCNVPAKVDMEVGPSWGEIHELAA